MNEISVYTQQDCNDLCSVLCRNGYVVTINNIITPTSNTICPKQWRITYYDPKDIKVEDKAVKTIKCWKCGKILTDENISNKMYPSFPPKYACKDCEE